MELQARCASHVRAGCSSFDWSASCACGSGGTQHERRNARPSPVVTARKPAHKATYSGTGSRPIVFTNSVRSWLCTHPISSATNSSKWPDSASVPSDRPLTATNGASDSVMNVGAVTLGAALWFLSTCRHWWTRWMSPPRVPQNMMNPAQSAVMSSGYGSTNITAVTSAWCPFSCATSLRCCPATGVRCHAQLHTATHSQPHKLHAPRSSTSER